MDVSLFPTAPGAPDSAKKNDHIAMNMTFALSYLLTPEKRGGRKISLVSRKEGKETENEDRQGIWRNYWEWFFFLRKFKFIV